MDKNKIVNRIMRESGQKDLLKILTEMKFTDLQTLLLGVFQARASAQKPTALLEKYAERNRFMGVSEISQRKLGEFEKMFFDSISQEFESVELSPIGPLGTNAALANVHQNKVLSTIKGSEVVSDPTTMLALEAAYRLQQARSQGKPNEQIHLATIKRLLRLQPFDPKLGYMQHFRCVGAVSAGRDMDHGRSLMKTFQIHIKMYLDFIKTLQSSGFAIDNPTVRISNIRVMEQIATFANIDRKELMLNTGNPDFNPFEMHNIPLPSFAENLEELNSDFIQACRLERSLKFLHMVDEVALAPLRAAYPWAKFVFHLERIAGIGYYDGFCFHIHGANQNGRIIQLVDGGFTDWMRKLMQSQKDFCMISGIGAELVQKLFQKL